MFIRELNFQLIHSDAMPPFVFGKIDSFRFRSVVGKVKRREWPAEKNDDYRV